MQKTVLAIFETIMELIDLVMLIVFFIGIVGWDNDPMWIPALMTFIPLFWLAIRGIMNAPKGDEFDNL